MCINRNTIKESLSNLQKRGSHVAAWLLAQFEMANVDDAIDFMVLSEEEKIKFLLELFDIGFQCVFTRVIR